MNILIFAVAGLGLCSGSSQNAPWWDSCFMGGKKAASHSRR